MYVLIQYLCTPVERARSIRATIMVQCHVLVRMHAITARRLLESRSIRVCQWRKSVDYSIKEVFKARSVAVRSQSFVRVPDEKAWENGFLLYP